MGSCTKLLGPLNFTQLWSCNPHQHGSTMGINSVAQRKKNMIYAVHECPGPAGPDKPSHTCAVMCLFHLFLGHGSPPGWDPLATKNWLFLLDTDHCQCCFIPQIRRLIIIFLKCTIQKTLVRMAHLGFP